MTGTALFDPRDDAVQQCPFAAYARLRSVAPVHEMAGDQVGRPGERVFVVSRHDLVSEVLTDWRTFSSQFQVSQSGPPAHMVPTLTEIASRGWPRPNTMLTADPPVHTKYRRLVSQAFGPRRVEAMRSTITRVCDGLADAIAERADGVVDMIPAYCVPIPATVVAIALGVPEERFADFKRWADASVAPIGRTLDDAGWIEYAEGVVELQHYFAGEFEARRAEPRDDLLTDLLDGTLEMAELLSIVQQLQVAGSETTASLIADAVVFLADQPGEWDRIAADPSRAVPVVEECLRLSSPNQGLYRTVTTDTELGGVAIPKGATVWVLYASANRDARVFGDDAESFDAGRPSLDEHIAFGKGVHHCVGAPLARLEGAVALQALARRFTAIEPVDRDALRYGPSFILRGLTALPVRLTPR